MNDRLIKFFDPISVPGSAEPVGLAEFLLQNALNSTDAFASAEACDLVTLLFAKISAMQGMKQKDQTITLSQGQWEMLRDWSRPKVPVKWELSHAVSLCMKALHNAEQITEKT